MQSALARLLYLAPLLISLAVCVGIGQWAWRRRSVAGAVAFAAAVAGQTAWILGFIFETLSSTLAGKVFWDNLQWTAGLAWPSAALIFALEYTGRPRPRRGRAVAVLAALIGLVSLVVVTDSWHGWLTGGSYQLAPGTPVSFLQYDLGPAVWVILTYFYLLFLIAVALLIVEWRNQPVRHRPQTAIIIAGWLVPLADTLLTALGFTLGPQRDIAPYTFGIGNLIIAWGLLRFRLFDVIPVAREIVVDSLRDAVLVLDDKRRIVYLNPAARALLSIDRRDVIGLTLEELLPTWTPWIERFQTIGETRQEIAVETGAGVRFFEVTVSPVPSPAGQLAGQAIVVREITKRKQAEIALVQAHAELEQRVRERTVELSRANAALADSQERLSRMVEAVPDGILILGRSGHVVFANPAAGAIFGLEPAQLIGRQYTGLDWSSSGTNGNSGERAELPIARVLRDQVPAFGAALEVRHAAGRRIALSVNAVSLRSPSGEPEGVVAALMDVTERQAAEAALRASDERYRAFVTNSSEGIWRIEFEHPIPVTAPVEEQIEDLYRYGYVAECNDTCARWFGRQRAEDLLGTRLEGVLSRSDPWSSGLLLSFIRSGYRLYDAERYRPDAVGQLIYTASTSFGVVEGGCLVRMWGVLRDITERRRAEAALRLLNAELESRVKARTRELTALYDLSALASQPLDLPTMLTRSLARVLEAIECPTAAVYLPEGESGGWHVAAQSGDSGLNASLAALPGLVAPTAQTEASMPAWVRPGSGQPELPAIAAWLRAGDRTVGVLGLLGKAPTAFSSEEQAMVAAAADQLGIMVENARLHSEAAQAAVGEERQRLARELHDSVTQLIYGLTLHAQAAHQAVESGNSERAGHSLLQVGEAARQALREMRLLVHELRPSILKSAGLAGALRRRLDSVEGRSGIAARLVADGLPNLPPTIEEAFYWIAQEALNNALKHSRSMAVEVRLSVAAGQACLEVVDFGAGFEPEVVAENGGLGLGNMREHARKIGGELKISSTVDRGTSVTCVVAIPSADRQP